MISNEIMIRTAIILVFVFIFEASSSFIMGQDFRYNQVKTIDTLKLNASVLETIDFPFVLIIDNHLKQIKRIKWFLQGEKHLLIVYIRDNDAYFMSQQEQENKHNKFVTKDYGKDSGYDIFCQIIKKNSVLLDFENLFYSAQKKFYYKYKDWDVILISELNINFPNILGTKNIELIYESIRYEPNSSGEYSTNKFIRLANRRQPKKYEKFITSYMLLSHGLYFIEYTTLYENIQM